MTSVMEAAGEGRERISAIGFAGYSDSGKTTLIARLAAWFEEKGIRTAVIKHDAHGHYKEAADTDSSKFVEGGASGVVVISPEEVRIRERGAFSIPEIVHRIRDRYELFLIEGFKTEGHDKMAVFRTPEQAGIMDVIMPPVAAWVTDHAEYAGRSPDVPVFGLNDIESIAEFICKRYNLTAP